MFYLVKYEEDHRRTGIKDGPITKQRIIGPYQVNMALSKNELPQGGVQTSCQRQLKRCRMQQRN